MAVAAEARPDSSAVAAQRPPFQVAIARNERWGLVFCHVVGGGLWTGIDLFVGFVVGPIIGRLPSRETVLRGRLSNPPDRLQRALGA